MKSLQLAILFVLCSAITFAQETFPVNGPQDKRPQKYAFTNGIIHVDYKTQIDGGTLLVEKGRIVTAGNDAAIPNGYIIIDLKGKHVYPSFIDLYSDYGLPPVKKKENNDRLLPQMESKKQGAYGWNEAIKPEQSAEKEFTVDKKSAEEYRKFGFGAVLTHFNDGIARGTGALVSLQEAKENEVLLKGVASAHYSFQKGVSTQAYPSSLMGAIALLRQTYLDAAWYQDARDKVESNLSLEAWNDIQPLPQIFAVNDVLSIFRADKIGDEFGVQYIIKTSGDDYQRLEAVKKTGAALIVPINFPKAYDVEDPLDARNVSLAEMKHWEIAPANPAFLDKAGVTFALTSAELEEKKQFLPNLRKAIKYGLSKESALKALTVTPAHIIKMDKELGTLEKGKVANFLITSDELFEKDCKILENWVQGKQYVILKEEENIDGKYKLTYGDEQRILVVEGSPFSTKAKIELNDTTTIPVTLTFKKNLVTLVFDPNADTVSNEQVRLSGLMEGKSWSGHGQLGDGSWVKWECEFVEGVGKKKQDEKKPEKVPQYGKVIYPFVAYGYEKKPVAETVLFKNGTVWTNEQEGVLENTDVLIKNGKIAAIGKDLASSGAKVIDATGKHITCGIVDEHSHIAISRGVNEGSQASSAEVRIGDVINSEDINIYRQLAGGVTTIQQLHGSANPIGGQSSITKLRWGYLPEDMKLEGTPGFIKFALGENVKQSNWGDRYRIRYPQTRMGVEQIYVDFFTKAREYEKARQAYNSLSKKKKQATTPVRPQLELDALLEVLNKQRFVTCHSYVQSEITMLMKVAERFHFRINTFTHVLEGYKVADKLKAHGANASTFSDWWAYKYEVIDAIPYNAAILNEVGVNTAINSDDAEMGRRLNQEAAKTIKYGGVSEEDAWKMVTLNPARMLHIDDRVGSIKVGKDADIVVWSDHPLSVYAKVEQTYVDGICFFDLQKDQQMRKQISRERARLVQKMLEAKKQGQPTQKAKQKNHGFYHCDDLEETPYLSE